MIQTVPGGSRCSGSVRAIASHSLRTRRCSGTFTPAPAWPPPSPPPPPLPLSPGRTATLPSLIALALLPPVVIPCMSASNVRTAVTLGDATEGKALWPFGDVGNVGMKRARTLADSDGSSPSAHREKRQRVHEQGTPILPRNSHAMLLEPRAIIGSDVGWVTRRGDRTENQDAYVVEDSLASDKLRAMLGNERFWDDATGDGSFREGDTSSRGVIDFTSCGGADTPPLSDRALIAAKTTSLSELSSPDPSPSATGQGAHPPQRSASLRSKIGFLHQSLSIFAVFDGHGPCGMEAARTTGRILPNKLRSHLPPCSTFRINEEVMRRALCSAIADVQVELLANARTKPSASQEYGTTLVAAVLWGGNRVTVANVGDSRAVLFRRGENAWETLPVSMDHSLDRPDERARITRMKGQVLKTREVERVLPDPQEVPRDLVMQRNIALVLAEPEFHSFQACDGDILVLASDGLWDRVSNAEACTVISSKKDQHPKEISRLLARMALDRSREVGVPSDNVTVVVVRFERVGVRDVLRVDSAWELEQSEGEVSFDDGARTPVLYPSSSDVDSSVLERCQTPYECGE